MITDTQTILLWGQNLWGCPDDPLQFSHPEQAAAALAAEFREGKPPLRLIYQPDTLVTVPVRCENAGRMILGAVWAREFPALADPACAWSYDFVMAQGDYFSTNLYFEREPGALGVLTRQLEAQGFVIESVWPLAAFLHALPVVWDESRYSTIFLLQEQHACGCQRNVVGDGRTMHWSGPHALAESAAWLRTVVARNPKERIALVFEDGAGMALNDLFPFLDIEELNYRLPEIWELLSAPVVLPRHHPAQLIPPPPLLP